MKYFTHMQIKSEEPCPVIQGHFTRWTQWSLLGSGIVYPAIHLLLTELCFSDVMCVWRSVTLTAVCEVWSDVFCGAQEVQQLRSSRVNVKHNTSHTSNCRSSTHSSHWHKAQRIHVKPAGTRVVLQDVKTGLHPGLCFASSRPFNTCMHSRPFWEIWRIRSSQFKLKWFPEEY